MYHYHISYVYVELHAGAFGELVVNSATLLCENDLPIIRRAIVDSSIKRGFTPPCQPTIINIFQLAEDQSNVQSN